MTYKAIDTKSEAGTARSAQPGFTAASLKQPVELSRIIHKIGHEIGNPLTSIISLASIIERSSVDAPETLAQEKLTSYAGSIGKEAWRITALNERMVLLFSDRSGTPSPTDAEQTIRRTVSRLHRRPEYRCYDVSIVHSEPELQVWADGEQFQWVISALLENAFQAQTAETKETGADENFEPLTASLTREGSDTLIQFTNLKRSPCPVDLASLFDPFVTLPVEAKRAGLGLTVSAVIIERLGGTIELSESPQDGSFAFTAKVRLPAGPR